jgi:hypothetical protein
VGGGGGCLQVRYEKFQSVRFRMVYARESP